MHYISDVIKKQSIFLRKRRSLGGSVAAFPPHRNRNVFVPLPLRQGAGRVRRPISLLLVEQIRTPADPAVLLHVLQRGTSSDVQLEEQIQVVVEQQGGDVKAGLHAPARVMKHRAAVVIDDGKVPTVHEDKINNFEVRTTTCHVEY